MEMFSTLSSYIWSSGSEDQTVPDLSEDNLLEERGEDEWILVDIVNEKANAQSDKNGRAEKCKQTPEPVPRTVDALEESWYVTPPSCFNASQEDSLSLQTSPLENLLIEHPSMSVYGGPTDTWLAVAAAPSEETPENDDTGETAVETRTHTHRRAVRTVDQAKELSRRVQKSVLDQTEKQYKNKKLQAQNQTNVRVTRSRRKQKKVDRKQGKHSTVYSNRGC